MITQLEAPPLPMVDCFSRMFLQVAQHTTGEIQCKNHKTLNTHCPPLFAALHSS